MMFLKLKFFLFFFFLLESSAQEICSSKLITADSGTLTSPDYPSDDYTYNYTPMDGCTVTFPAIPGKLLEVEFKEFNLNENYYYDYGCSFESVSIEVDGQQVEADKICFENQPHTFSTSKEVKITYIKNQWTFSKGFKLAWRRINDICEDQFRCWDGTCVALSEKCDGVINCPDKSDEIQCVHEKTDQNQCGKNAIAPKFPWTYRVMNGGQAIPHSWPFVLSFFDDSSKISRCTGTIVSPRHILTSSLCLGVIQSRSYRLKLGTHQGIDTPKFTTTIEKTYTPPGDMKVYIVLLETKDTIPFDNTIQPICIPDSKFDLPDGESCITGGWGSTGKDTDDVNVKFTQIRYFARSQEYCKEKAPLQSNEICAELTRDTDGGLCRGDYGSPLMCLKDGSWYQVGASTSANCLSNYPDNFVDVRPYSEFINRIIGNDSQSEEATTTTYESTTKAEDLETTTSYESTTKSDTTVEETATPGIVASTPGFVTTVSATASTIANDAKEFIYQLASNLNPISRLITLIWEAAPKYENKFNETTRPGKSSLPRFLKNLLKK